MRISYLLFIFLLLIVACKKEKNITVETETRKNVYIVPGLEKYVDRFFAEAKKRGLSLNENDLEVVFQDVRGFCGYGYPNYQNTNLRRVEIDPGCWKDQRENWKEALMFHELGHAVLRRIHFNSVLPNGLAKSMMCGTGIDYNKCSDQHGTTLYSSFTPKLRDYYLDELFDSTTPEPALGKIKSKQNGKVVFQENFEGEANWEFRGPKGISDSIYTAAISFDESANTTVATINSNKSRDNTFYIWTTTFESPAIAEGNTLELKATISTENLEGKGATLAFRIDAGNKDYFEPFGFATTQGDFSFRGTTTNQYTVTASYCPSEVYQVRIFLMVQPNTKGKVSFDNIEMNLYD